mmetsp:Transcript_99391/g.280466  ORF Transcript_99391/g.280466 Transcript_99391/m.280466 type:complete len:367 (-) Transcript_99391:192-1292(-)
MAARGWRHSGGGGGGPAARSSKGAAHALAVGHRGPGPRSWGWRRQRAAQRRWWANREAPLHRRAARARGGPGWQRLRNLPKHAAGGSQRASPRRGGHDAGGRETRRHCCWSGAHWRLHDSWRRRPCGAGGGLEHRHRKRRMNRRSRKSRRSRRQRRYRLSACNNNLRCRGKGEECNRGFRFGWCRPSPEHTGWGRAKPMFRFGLLLCIFCFSSLFLFFLFLFSLHILWRPLLFCLALPSLVVLCAPLVARLVLPKPVRRTNLRVAHFCHSRVSRTTRTCRACRGCRLHRKWRRRCRQRHLGGWRVYAIAGQSTKAPQLRERLVPLGPLLEVAEAIEDGRHFFNQSDGDLDGRGQSGGPGRLRSWRR